MYCPKCKSEYREGFFECANCHISLVEHLSKEPESEESEIPKIENVELVTAFKSGSVIRIAIAKSILYGADINYFAKGEIIQNIFGAGTIGTGYSTLVGPIQIQVEKSQLEEAKDLLFDLIQDELGHGNNQ